MKITIVLLIALAASTVAVGQNVTYECKGPDGDWAAKYCTGAAKPKPSPYAKQKQQAAQDAKDMEHRRDAWGELCSSAGGYSSSCVDRHEDSFVHMQSLLQSQSITEKQRATMVQCFVRWYKSSVGVVDANMWRYCYAHAGL